MFIVIKNKWEKSRKEEIWIVQIGEKKDNKKAEKPQKIEKMLDIPTVLW